MEHALVRITLSYDEVRMLVATWSRYCEKMAVVEHEGEKTEKIHVHILMYNMAKTWKTMTNIFERDFPSIRAKVHGNECFAKKKAYKYDAFATIRYFIKGKYELSYNKGYEDPEFLKKARESWTVEVHKKSKLQLTLEKFMKYAVNEGYVVDKDNVNCLDFYQCKRVARQFVFQEAGEVFNWNHSVTLVKSIVYTMMMRGYFKIPEQEKKWDI